MSPPLGTPRLQSPSYGVLWLIAGGALLAMLVAVVAAIVLTGAEATRHVDSPKSGTPGADDDKTIYIDISSDSASPVGGSSAEPASSVKPR